MIKPLSQVDEKFAWDEGEGDDTHEWWLTLPLFRCQASREIRVRDDILTVFERFGLVWQLDVADVITGAFFSLDRMRDVSAPRPPNNAQGSQSKGLAHDLTARGRRSPPRARGCAFRPPRHCFHQRLARNGATRASAADPRKTLTSDNQ